MSGADYIVVGSGSGGAPVVRRLLEAGASVILIEAGESTLGVPEIEDAAGWFALQSGRWDWGHRYTPTERILGREIPIPRGLGLGGSSATNAMMWYRGVPADYARWDAVAPGWGWDDCLPAFRACETWHGAPDALRGEDGPMQITPPDPDHPLTQAMLGGARSMGLPENADPNGSEPLGVALANFNIGPDGRRWTSAMGYLEPVLNHPGLTLLTGARATEVLFDGDRACGVTVWRSGQSERLEATRGVILAAGALETPRLLQLSGIGPEAELARLGLPLRIRAEGVGENLQDHPLIRALNFRASRPLGPMKGNGGGTLTIWKSDAALEQADLLAFPVQGRSAVPALWDHYDLEGDVFAIGLGVMRSHSKGRMRLGGAAPDAPLDIQPNLLSDPRDLQALIRGVEFLQDMVASAGFGDLFAGYAAPDTKLTGAATETFVRRATSTFFHCCGTARMGQGDDAPVTPRLAVKGARGLWVADASVIPDIPACHTHAPVTMIGERAAQFVLEDQ
ncbi:GMC family oxidoreductase [Pseudooceanicola sp. CBS1P-1]|uniref:Glucose-methanol-choline oxidoreductase n=1 Tax=Pseudooceanicola albus TaxID=2692189 RepID=A0A6L7G537_9RHOB|nr:MULTISPECIES: GMC family oxidoreductase [Pseudooceanicola]MBT9385182.1 GMC family oxidoreductase [Pseudooceanicola endophyticus]MXN18526.1 glucose-methanol-choline oxidoreductase [Pseudooceanicola albus]